MAWIRVTQLSGKHISKSWWVNSPLEFLKNWKNCLCGLIENEIFLSLYKRIYLSIHLNCLESKYQWQYRIERTPMVLWGLYSYWEEKINVVKYSDFCPNSMKGTAQVNGRRKILDRWYERRLCEILPTWVDLNHRRGQHPKILRASTCVT